jgi:hypothetical protein
MKQFLILLSVLFFVSCNKKIVVERTTNFPKQTELMSETINKQNVWVFILAGQSNMAGRGIVEPQDTVANKRILSINKKGQLIIAKEPLHFYEPNLTGLDCGYAFAKKMIENIPDSISILLLPTAVGGSSISQWLGDSLFRNVKLFSNFLAKAAIGKQYGIIKGILWHQGESDANEKNIPHYSERLSVLFTKSRKAIGNDNLPILLGELGSFSKNKEGFELINKAIHNYSAQDANTAVITTADVKHKGDSLHFNSKAQRTIGRRFAEAYLNKFLQ